jgi:hypothetical protein
MSNQMITQYTINLLRSQHMLNNLKELLQNSQLQAKIKAAADQSTVIDLLLTAGTEVKSLHCNSYQCLMY